MERNLQARTTAQVPERAKGPGMFSPCTNQRNFCIMCRVRDTIANCQASPERLRLFLWVTTRARPASPAKVQEWKRSWPAKTRARGTTMAEGLRKHFSGKVKDKFAHSSKNRNGDEAAKQGVRRDQKSGPKAQVYLHQSQVEDKCARPSKVKESKIPALRGPNARACRLRGHVLGAIFISWNVYESRGSSNVSAKRRAQEGAKRPSKACSSTTWWQFCTSCIIQKLKGSFHARTTVQALVRAKAQAIFTRSQVMELDAHLAKYRNQEKTSKQGRKARACLPNGQVRD